MASQPQFGNPRPSASAKSDSETGTGSVRLDAIYTVEEFKRRLRWSDSTLRAARRRGLRVLRTGKRAFVAGNDFHDFLLKESCR